MKTTATVELGKMAATAPCDDDAAPQLEDLDRDLDVLCERWVAWCRSGRLCAPPPSRGNVLGRLSGHTRPLRPGADDAACSAELATFHIAYTCQPEALAKHVFDAYYVTRVKPIKTVAARLGVSRKHFYPPLRDFRRRVGRSASALHFDGRMESERLLAQVEAH